MNLSMSSFEKEMIRKLKDSNVVKYVRMDEILSDFNSESIRNMLSHTYKFEFDNKNNLCYIDESGEVNKCPYYGTSVSLDGEWLSQLLPSVSYDVDQGGNLRKAEEAECAYCAAMICLVLNNEDYSNELEDVITKYDFVKIAPLSDNGISFNELLQSWLDLQSRTNYVKLVNHVQLVTSVLMHLMQVTVLKVVLCLSS